MLQFPHLPKWHHFTCLGGGQLGRSNVFMFAKLRVEPGHCKLCGSISHDSGVPSKVPGVCRRVVECWGRKMQPRTGRLAVQNAASLLLPSGFRLLHLEEVGAWQNSEQMCNLAEAVSLLSLCL